MHAKKDRDSASFTRAPGNPFTIAEYPYDGMMIPFATYSAHELSLLYGEGMWNVVDEGPGDALAILPARSLRRAVVLLLRRLRALGFV